jgi:tetratricopeptide (TPR) repeat protein/uncharacterized caspase-like protein
MPDRLALIVANSAFEDSKLARLRTPTRDAEALAEVLADPAIGAFDVTLRVDQPEGVVRREIARIYRRRRKDDLLLLYYSGHGVRDDHGDLYLATHDTELDLLGATALDAAFVRAQIDKSRSRRKVVILDCCHSGAFAGSKAGLGDSVGTGEILGGYGRVILTASDALELAWEGGEGLGAGTGHLSAFTHFLVEGLRTGAADLDGDGRIDLDELYDYVYQRLLASGRARQTPHKWAQAVEGRLVIARNPHPRPRALPPDLRQAAESPVAWMREGAVRGLEALALEREGKAKVVEAARTTLARLAEDDHPRVAAAATAALDALPVSAARREARETLARLTQAVERTPQDATAWNRLGIVHYGLARYEDAITAYRAAIELDDILAPPWYNLGLAYERLRRYDDARAAYRAAIARDPAYAHPWHGLGNVYWALDRPEDAVAAYHRAIELDPTFSAPWAGLSVTYYHLGRYEDALAVHRRSLAVAPRPSGWTLLGNLYHALGRYDDALDAYQEALDLDPTYAPAWHGLGNVYTVRERQDDARVAYHQALELEPAAASHVGLAGVHRRLGNEPQAQRHLARARQLAAPDDHESWACIEALAGDVEAALDALEDLLARRPGLHAWASRDPDLAVLRDRPRFQALIATAAADAPHPTSPRG